MIGLQKWAALSCIISSRLSPSLRLPYLPVLHAEKQSPECHTQYKTYLSKMWLYSIFKVFNCVGVKQWHPCKFPVPTMDFQKKDPSHRECLLYSPYAIMLQEQKGGAHAAWHTKVIESLPLSHIWLLPLIKALAFAVLRVYLSAPCSSWDALKE